MLNYLIITAVLFVSTVTCFPEGRVVNGTGTVITKYPFMVSLRLNGSHICGGSIVKDDWVLTAAHCVLFQNPEELSIQYGSEFLDSNTTYQMQIKEIIIHEGYTSPTTRDFDDIALLQLTEKLTLNGETVAAVKLPELFYETKQIPQGEPGVLIGWGYNATGGVVQQQLQRVDLKIYSDAECQSRIYDLPTNANICAGVDEGGKGQCSGDSGGPLLDEQGVQLGIVSWSIKPCTIAPFPGVYTKVSHYVDWIEETIRYYSN